MWKKLQIQVKRLMSLVLPYRPMEADREVLERQYDRGYWDYLAGIDELARFSVLAGYCHFLKDAPSILEIGCGEGLLAERLCAARIGSYRGVDISEKAIERAKGRVSENVAFSRSDARTYSPDGSFDLILFTECLEYFDDPLSLVKRYEPVLASEGLLLVSMFEGVETRRSLRIWKMLETRYATYDSTEVTNAAGLSWTIRVLRPPDRFA